MAAQTTSFKTMKFKTGKNGTTKHENGEISCWNQLPGQDAGGERFLARRGGRCAFRGQSEGGDEELSVCFAWVADAVGFGGLALWLVAARGNHSWAEIVHGRIVSKGSGGFQTSPWSIRICTGQFLIKFRKCLKWIEFRHTIQDMSLRTLNTAFVIMQMYPRKMANSRFLRVHAKQFTVFSEHSAHTKLKIIIVMFNLHYRKPPVCRVGNTLPCAKTRAHGKPHLCRVPIERAHGN